MDIFSIDLTVPEIQTIRQSLDLITIAGKDARFLANLQTKLEHELTQISQMLTAEQTKKQEDLQKAIATDKKLK
jgi:hypothetical protein